MVTGRQDLPCPCGCGRQLTGPHAPMVRRWLEVLGPWVIVATPDGVWAVPRLFIAIHGLASVDLPTVAQAHGWPTVQ